MNKLLCASFQKRQEENKAKKQREERISNILRDDTYLPHFTNQETIEIVDNVRPKFVLFIIAYGLLILIIVQISYELPAGRPNNYLFPCNQHSHK